MPRRLDQNRVLWGASAFALMLGMATATPKADHEFIDSHQPEVINAAGDSFDYIFITDAEIDDDVRNDGEIGPGHSDDDPPENPYDTPARAVGITITDQSTIGGDVVNSEGADDNGLINVSASDDEASATGILIDGESSVDGVVQNDGDIVVHAEADGDGDVSARAQGIVVEGGAQTREGVNNAGTIELDAVASVEAAGEVEAAVLDVAGIRKALTSEDPIDSDIDNSGEIVFEAMATAESEDDAATATVGRREDDDEIREGLYGIYQAAHTSSNATIALNNSGSVSIAAAANAASGGAETDQKAIAAINMVGGAFQRVEDLDDVPPTGDVAVSATNAGAITLNLIAESDASAEDDDAFASAEALISDVFGIYQSLGGSNDDERIGGNAVAEVENTGLVTINAAATASGSAIGDDSASAAGNNDHTRPFGILAEISDIYGVFQELHSDGDASAAVANAGDIVLDLEAAAEAIAESDDRAEAEASALISDAFGIYQGMGDFEHQSAGKADAAVQNSGTISIAALANAEAKATSQTDLAWAISTASLTDVYGISQNIQNMGESTVSSVNDGEIQLDLKSKAQSSATAIDHFAEAKASAEITDVFGIYQGIQEASGDALAEVVNNGVLAISAETLAGAEAEESNDGAGAIASASASISSIYGIYQTIDDASGKAEAKVVNHGEITLATHSQGHAVAAGESSNVAATATGSVSSIYGIYQDIGSIDNDALAEVVNHGSIALDILATADAEAKGGDGNVSADASVSVTTIYGIYQHVSSDSGDATGRVINNGDLTVSIAAQAGATAEGSADVAATATASITDSIYGIYQDISGDTAGMAEVINTGAISLSIDSTNEANAESSAGAAQASANASSISSVYGIYQDVNGDEQATARIINQGEISVDLRTLNSATAIGGANNGNDPAAEATASMSMDSVFGLYQEVSSDSIGLAEITNTGTVLFSIDSKNEANAESSAGAAQVSASATATSIYGIYQDVSGDDEAAARILNQGEISVDLRMLNTAAAKGGANNGGDPAAQATASASMDTVYGIYQSAETDDGTASVVLTNDGELTVGLMAQGQATAEGMEDAQADGSADLAGSISGINQSASAGTQAATQFINDGTFTFAAIADVSADATSTAGAAKADAGGAVSSVNGIYQEISADGGALAEIVNDGDIVLEMRTSAEAAATGAGSEAHASAQSSSIAGISQSINGSDGGVASIDNQGAMRFTAQSIADAGAVGNSEADATLADAVGLRQWVESDGDATAEIINNGVLVVEGTAAASAPNGNATAATGIVGIDQRAEGQGAVRALFDNTGSVDVSGEATAQGDQSTATSMVIGARQNVVGSTVNFTNSGAYNVAATANAMGTDATSIADAVGAQIHGNLNANSLISNEGALIVDAKASAGKADARALFLDVDDFAGTIRNIGSDAIIGAYAEGHEAQAIGIGFGDDAITKQGARIINDGGTIRAATSQDGEGMVERGTAITLFDTDYEPIDGDPITIEWRGTNSAGSISGVVNIRQGDAIEVTNGQTRFDGVINNPSRRGTLSINDGGQFFIALDESGGPSQINVDTYTQTSSGAVQFEIGTTPGSIGRISASNVSLAGTVELVPRAGIFGDTIQFENVITTDNGTGAWETVIVPSGLLGAEALQFGTGTGSWTSLNFEIVRTPFDEVPDLTDNELAVAGGIESAYSGLLDGLYGGSDYETLISSLFTLDMDDYRDALEQLHGSIYGQALQSLSSSFDLMNRAADLRLDQGPMSRARSFAVFGNGADPDVGDKDQNQPGTMWVQAQGSWGSVSGDENAPSYDRDRQSVLLGADLQVTPNLLSGIAAGYYGANLDAKDDRSSLDYNGWQIGAYGQYDLDSTYVRALAAYGKYRGQGTRRIDIGSISGTVRSQFDAAAWTAGAEIGHRFEVMEQGWLTPYAGLTYSNGTLNSFTEDGGGTGAALTVSGDGKSLVSDLGVRAGYDYDFDDTTTVGATLRLGWQRELGDNLHSFDAAFDGIANSDFTAVGSERAKDSLVLDAGVAVTITDEFELGASYSGRYNTDVTDHSISATGRLRF